MKNDNNFAVIRLLAAFLVLSGHMSVLINAPIPAVLYNGIARLGLIIFFLIGGYLVTNSWKNDRGYLRYLTKRIMRIFPSLIIFVLLAAFVVGPLLSRLTIKEYFENPLFFNYFKNIFLNINYNLPGLFEQNPYPNAVNGSIWSLPVEFFMYLIIPIVYEIGKKLNGRLHIIITFLVCFLSILQVSYFPDWRCVIYGSDLGQALSIIPYYFLGSLVATLEIDKKVWNFQVAFIILFLVQCFSYVSIELSLIISYISIPYIIFSFAFTDNAVTSKLSLLRKYEISYGIYLYGFFVQQVVILYFMKLGINLRFEVILLICTLTTSFLALLNYIFVEQPMKKLTKNIISNLNKNIL